MQNTPSLWLGRKNKGYGQDQVAISDLISLPGLWGLVLVGRNGEEGKEGGKSIKKVRNAKKDNVGFLKKSEKILSILNLGTLLLNSIKIYKR